jgi:predicted nuclease of restriction endonuclease-like (RecB) superfamily
MSKGLTRYVEVLTNLKEKIRLARQKSMLAVNAHLIIVYYEIGAAILEQQTTEGWGAKVIDRLSIDLRLAFPDMKGFSVRNIKYMRAFAEAWPEGFQENNGRMQNVENQENGFVQQGVAQIPWGHHVILLDKVKSRVEREFYIIKIIENGWSRDVWAAQIHTQLYQRQGKAITNFALTLPAPLSDLAQETLKNPYNLEFTGLSDRK